MPCPKCGAASADGAATCAACGLVFANYDPAAQARLRQARETVRAEAARSRRAMSLVLAAAFVVLLAGLWWFGRTPAQAFVAPTGEGRLFSGLAHDYAGAGAELYLVQGGHTVQAIGRIERGGRFRFELPGRLSLSRLTPTMVLQLRNMGPGPSATNDRNRERIARWPAQPESAVHALYAGDGWSDLSVEPLEMNVARYGVAYGGQDGHGDLFAANAEMGRIALPGQAMVVLVYADRAGRVRGDAHSLNAFGAEVKNRWELELRPGWNLVTSEQNDDMATLSYRSGRLPDGLEWWTLAGR
jgi:hypothetical protein